MTRRRFVEMKALVLAGLFALVPVTVVAEDGQFGPWQPAVSVDVWPGASPPLNTAAFVEGCPSVAPDGLSLYFASNRSGGYGGLDLYVSHRAKRHGPWGPAVNLGSTINTGGDEFCPTPLRDGVTLLYVSTRQDLAHCGGADIYRSTNGAAGWTTPVNLGCSLNSSADEASPFLVREGGAFRLYFSSTRSGVSHIYSAAMTGNWTFGDPALVAGINSTAADARPNVRHDGLEMCFDSKRGGLAAEDIFLSTRASTSDALGTPVNAGANVNSTARDIRCSISWDATTMYFSSTRAGSMDIWVTRRASLD
jgi:Tol biopolymer transport system component